MSGWLWSTLAARSSIGKEKQNLHWLGKEGEELTVIKVEDIKEEEEETYVRGDQQCKEEEIPTDISTGQNHFLAQKMETFLNIGKKRASEEKDYEPHTSGKVVKKRKHRRYNDTYLDFGFTSVDVNQEVRPKCVLCMKILSAESMIPSKLRRHLDTNHPDVANKPRDYFARKLKELKDQKGAFFKQASISTNAVLAAYKVAYRVARCIKPHTIAEDLILPAAVDMVTIMVGESAGKLLSKVPLSNNTMSHRIQHMAEDLNVQLIEKMKGKEFALQLDEATDSNKDAHLICYTRFVDGDNIVEDLLFCKSITAGAKAQDMFQIIDTFMSENNLDWTECVGVCTDGGRSMSGCYGRLQALIRSKAPDALWTHCIIHREALASEQLSPPLNAVMESVLKVVNFIKTRPQKARFLKKMCEAMGSEHTSLLYYCSSRWLSRGNVLAHIFELRQELYSYLEEEVHECANNYLDTDFLSKLAYLCDLFDKLNALNLSLQGSNTHILKLSDKVSAFRKKLLLWKRKLNEDRYNDCFPLLHQFVTSNDVYLTHELKSVFEQHLTKLSDWFEKYFPENMETFVWIQDPFSTKAPSEFTSIEEEKLIELSCDKSLKLKFIRMGLEEFWISIKDEYPMLSTKAQRMLVPFATTDMCEAGFSAVAVIKSKYCSKINVEQEMRVAVSKLIPRFEKLCSAQQAHTFY
ncbi:protein FAM200A-like isoform X2 [Mixophyes fleayi]|uniref:protein FAM200A-like isoform X2 n=1 Tax=Mixophyes fleayi TaxID=3061075 RepID=UPI003F4DF466